MAQRGEIPAPGARIVVRDAQWLVRKVERTQGGGHTLFCIGLSEIVRDKEAQFLTRAEKKIEILDPAKTQLVADTSPYFQDSRLYLESLLRKTVPTDGRIYCGHKAAMDSVPYQLDPAALALSQPRQRLLIADAVGLGKTLECGILLAELIRRGRGRRILVVTVKSMMTQFQKELWSRFSIPLTRLDSVGLHRVREQIPTNHNPFHYFDKSIVSVDTLKQDAEYRTYLENAYWDVIVIDEAHNVAERGSGRISGRARLARLLSGRSDSLILLSATPHDGSSRSFASLMNMLDPTAITNVDDYGPDDIRGLFIRRFKKDIKAQVRTEFKEREIHTIKAQASPAEEAVFDALTGADFRYLNSRKGAQQLFRTVLEKALFSSPDACRETVAHRLHTLQAAPERAVEAAEDIAALQELQQALAQVDAASFAKFKALVDTLKDKASPFHFTGKETDDRLIIFTERIATLDFLHAHLPKALGLKDKQVVTLRGTDADVEQQEVVEAFGKEESPVRLLIASDVASEGINLHYLCNKMIHFDVPWSLMLFQQRNGRIDRYGQKRTPYIGYLMTESRNTDIRGDTRILELLVQKDEAATQNIGDPSAFLGLYDVEAEENKVAAAMENGSAESLAAEMEARVQDSSDPLAFLQDLVASTEEERPPVPETAALPSLFRDDYEYARTALHKLELADVVVREEEQALEFPLDGNAAWCKELAFRFRQFPPEVRREKVLRLSARKDEVQRDMAACRKEEHAWPRVQYLWELHPVMRWLSDKVTASFRRQEAPVLVVPGLAAGESLFIISGVIPNLKGQPVVDSWFACRFLAGRPQEDMDLPTALAHAGLTGQRPPNTGQKAPLERLQALLPDVVARARQHMSAERAALQEALRPRLDEQLQRLQQLQAARLAQLQQHRMTITPDNRLAQQRLDARERSTNSLFDDYKLWIRETLQTEDRPYIRIAAVIVAAGE